MCQGLHSFKNHLSPLNDRTAGTVKAYLTVPQGIAELMLYKTSILDDNVSAGMQEASSVVVERCDEISAKHCFIVTPSE